MLADFLLAGLRALQDYVVLHVVTCLVPAFLLAGGIVTFVSKEALVSRLGAAASRPASFATAAGASVFLAACSCTVIPVASGLYYGGAGVGAAFILLWVAPAANLLSLVYTGTVLGAGMAWVRVLTALAMALAVGTVMTAAFRREETARALPARQGARARLLSGTDAGLLGLVAVSLLAPNYLVGQGPYAHKVAVWAATSALAAGFAVWRKPRDELARWLQETWWFVRIIVPLLLAGVFIVGVIGAALPREWIATYLGGSGLRPSFLATLLGSVSYFATMTEAPFVHTLLGLGMGKGPALALLLAGPGLSLPNWLAIARVFGPRKAAVYVATIIVLGTLGGWLAGTFILR